MAKTLHWQNKAQRDHFQFDRRRRLNRAVELSTYFHCHELAEALRLLPTIQLPHPYHYSEVFRANRMQLGAASALLIHLTHRTYDTQRW